MFKIKIQKIIVEMTSSMYIILLFRFPKVISVTQQSKLDIPITTTYIMYHVNTTYIFTCKVKCLDFWRHDVSRSLEFILVLILIVSSTFVGF